jgi:hypothetical protein
MPAKKASLMKKLAFWKPAKRRKKSTRPPWWKTTPALAGATTCVMLAAMLIAAYQSAEPRLILPAHTVPAATMSRVEPSIPAPATPPGDAAPAAAPATPATPGYAESCDDHRMSRASR